MKYAYKRCACKAKIGKRAALKKVAKFSGIKYSVVKKASCKYTYQKKQGLYKVNFRYKGHQYEYKLLAPNGKVVKWETKSIAR